MGQGFKMGGGGGGHYMAGQFDQKSSGGIPLVFNNVPFEPKVFSFYCDATSGNPEQLKLGWVDLKMGSGHVLMQSSAYNHAPFVSYTYLNGTLTLTLSHPLAGFNSGSTGEFYCDYTLSG